MNVLFLIGNGFDLNLGMKTSYSDFYKYYKEVHKDSVPIRKLKEEISRNFKNWSDLELELGRYTEKIESTQQFDEIFEDIGEELSKYLQHEEDQFDFSKVDKKKLHDFLSFPENSLPDADRIRITSLRDRWKSLPWYVRIVTFNYTRTLEKLLGDKTNKLQIGSHHNSGIVLQGIEHIHGYANDRMVMGVNDISQIKNTAFHNNQDVIEALVKSSCNQATRHNKDILCKEQISSAHLICIYGSSLGDTDILWWELIGKRLTNDCNLIIFSKGEEINPRIAYKKGRIERAIKESFLNKTNLPEETKRKIEKNIIIGLNTDMFSIVNKRSDHAVKVI